MIPIKLRLSTIYYNILIEVKKYQSILYAKMVRLIDFLSIFEKS